MVIIKTLNVVHLDEFITLSGAVAYPQVNGLWEKEEETNGGKVVYKHATESLFIFADMRNNGNWHINSEIEDGDTFYWTWPSSQIPMEEGEFYIAGPEFNKSTFFITPGDANGKNHNCS